MLYKKIFYDFYTILSLNGESYFLKKTIDWWPPPLPQGTDFVLRCLLVIEIHYGIFENLKTKHSLCKWTLKILYIYPNTPLVKNI